MDAQIATRCSAGTVSLMKYVSVICVTNVVVYTQYTIFINLCYNVHLNRTIHAFVYGHTKYMLTKFPHYTDYVTISRRQL